MPESHIALANERERKSERRAVARDQVCASLCLCIFSISFFASTTTNVPLVLRTPQFIVVAIHWNGSLWSSYLLLLQMWRIRKTTTNNFDEDVGCVPTTIHHNPRRLSISSFISLFLVLLWFFLSAVDGRPFDLFKLLQMKNEPLYDRIHMFLRHLSVCVHRSVRLDSHHAQVAIACRAEYSNKRKSTKKKIKRKHMKCIRFQRSTPIPYEFYFDFSFSLTIHTLVGFGEITNKFVMKWEP